MSSRFDPRLFFEGVQNVAFRIAAHEALGLLRRSLKLPETWGAMVSRTSGAKDVVRPGGVIERGDANELLFFRWTPIEIAYSEDRLETSDAHACRVDVRLNLRLIPEPGDLASFAESVLSHHRVIQVPVLVRFLQPSIHTMVVSWTSARTAQALTDPATCAEASEAVCSALQAPCFAAGLAIEGKPVFRVESESMRAVQETRQRASRALAEHEAAGDLRRAMAQTQRAHLTHVADMLQRLNELAASTPEAPLGALIRTFPEVQRGELYGALFAIEPPISCTRWIVIVAGDDLLCFEPTRLDRPRRTMRIEGVAGRMRSVQVGSGSTGSSMLWIGAERGVYGVPWGSDQPEQTFVVSKAGEVRGGFNSVGVVAGSIFASHSELGIRRWSLHQEAAGVAVLEGLTRGAKTVRHVQSDSGDLYCAIDHRVVRWSPDRPDESATAYTGSVAAITALRVVGEEVYVGNADGDVLRWSVEHPDRPERLHMGTQRAVESVSLLDTHGVRRLLFADTSPRIHARVIGDHFTRFYEAGGQTLRRARVAADLVVATNELRDRVFVWSTGAPGAACGVIPVGSLTGRSVQDVCLVANA